MKKLNGGNLDIDLISNKDCPWKQDSCPWNEEEKTNKHKCAVKNVSICDYFCGIEFPDKILCKYNKKAEKQSIINKIQIRKLTDNDILALSSLIDEMNKNLENPEWFLPMSATVEKARFSIYGFFIDGYLAGVFSLDYKNGKLPERMEFPCDVSKMVEFSFGIVAIKYRGNGIMHYALDFLQKEAKSQGFQYACASVNPDNYPSRNNLIKIGMEKIGFIDNDGKYPRDIMLLELK